MLTFPLQDGNHTIRATVLGPDQSGNLVFAVDDGAGNSKPMLMGIEQARRWSHFKDDILAVGADVVIRARHVPRGKSMIWEGFINRAAKD